MIDVSIIICTRDRAASLKETLASLAGQLFGACRLAELVVVDNGSSDETRDVVEAARPMFRGMDVVYQFEPDGGQSRARNTGLCIARGRVIVFTDDDLRFPSNWIEEMACPILADEADAIAGGVRLAPHLIRPWMTPLHRSWLASTECVDVRAPRLVGANMAFGRHVLEKVKGFDPKLGPGASGFADDSQFGEALRQAGFRIHARLDIEVEHHFDPDRLTPAAFAAMAEKHGRTEAYLAQKRPDYMSWRFAAAKWKFWVSSIGQRLRACWRKYRCPKKVPDVDELSYLKWAAFWRASAMEGACHTGLKATSKIGV